jgi:hypothetical protein
LAGINTSREAGGAADRFRHPAAPGRPRRRWGRALFWAASATAAGLAAASCASYSTRLRALRETVASGNLEQAAARIDKETEPGELLHHLEQGLVLRLAGDYRASNAELERAEILLEELYTISLSRRGLTFLLHDEADAYRGEEHEASYLHFYRILNFLALEERGAAVVEARRLALRLETLRAGEAGASRSDPFLEYLTGVLFETSGEWNEALIAYRLAAAGWADSARAGTGHPPWLAADLSRAAARAGIAAEAVPELAMLAGELEAGRAGSGGEESSGPTGDLFVLFEEGWTPAKVSEHVRVPLLRTEVEWKDSPSGEEKDERSAAAGRAMAERYREHRRTGAWPVEHTEIAYLLDAAVPVLAEAPVGRAATCRLIVRQADGGGVGSRAVRTLRLADLAEWTRQAFREREPGILARTFARALVKYLAKHQAEKQGGKLMGILANLLGVATEKADTRAWLLLPGEIQAARLRLPPGEYDLRLAALDAQGDELERRDVSVRIAPGEVRFVSWRSFR